MKVLDGKKVADEICMRIRRKIDDGYLKPELAVLLIGNNPASEIYTMLKKKRAEEIGVKCTIYAMKETVSVEEVLQKIDTLNHDRHVNGIIVQLPLPASLPKQEIINAIDKLKDVDGFHSENIAHFLDKSGKFWPVFPKALIIMLCEGLKVSFTGKILNSSNDEKARKAVIIGRSHEFKITMIEALKRYNIDSEFIRYDEISKPESKEKIKVADIIITACGVLNLIDRTMTKNTAVIIDGGIIKVDGKVFGDVDRKSFENADVVLSPVPGGVGPVTIACLFENVIEAHCILNKNATSVD